MSLQNRVNPFGEIFATSARGAWMGNRGCLHDAERALLSRRWTRKAWVTCVLEYDGIRRELMAPGQYTELFFLDEATAFAAGHRPCASCRMVDHKHFKRCWFDGNREVDGDHSITTVDHLLHAERVDTRTRTQRPWRGELADLPDGTFVYLSATRSPWLVARSRLWRWTESGYADSRPIADTEPVTVLTPRSICNAFRAGYTPQTAPVHASVGAA